VLVSGVRASIRVAQGTPAPEVWVRRPAGDPISLSPWPSLNTGFVEGQAAEFRGGQPELTLRTDDEP
jgi:hypothetical protein